MKFDCKYDEMLNIGKIKPHPKNNNKHTKEQLSKFCEIISKKGVWRVPLIVSKKSGYLVSGHLRLQAAKELKLPKLPVVYQDFKNEADEYQFLTFDNEIARWAELDPKYCDVIIKRWQEFTGNHAILEGTKTRFDDLDDVKLKKALKR
jgi:hypothetical protein